MATQPIEYQVVEVTKGDIRTHISAIESLIAWSLESDNTLHGVVVQDSITACQFFKDLLL